MNVFSIRKQWPKLRGRMRFWMALAATVVALPGMVAATSVTLQGSFTHDDNVGLFDFTVVAPDVIGSLSVDLRSYGYAGGTTNNGQNVPRGGFDTVLTLFTETGTLIAENDDGLNVAVDPLTGLAADARITATLASGNYILALTQYDSFANSTSLSGGFSEDGHPNFTADPAFTTGGSCPSNQFRDISGTSAACRNGSWTVDFVNVVSATERDTATTPEPSTAWLFGFGLFLFGIKTLRRKRWAAAVPVAFLLFLSSGNASAQTDFSQVGDILSGNRQVLLNQDLLTGWIGQDNNVYTKNLLSKNSTFLDSQAQPTPCNVNYSMLHRSFAARYYSADHDTSMTVCTNSGLEHFVQLADNGAFFNTQSFGGEGDTIFSAAMADFTGSGYPQLVVNYGSAANNNLSGSLMFVSAANADGTRNLHFANSGSGQAADRLIYMTAGDFDGDGRPEIAALAYTGFTAPLNLIIYRVDPKTFAITTAAVITPKYDPENLAIPFVYSITAAKLTSEHHQQIVFSHGYLYGSVKIVAFDFAPGSLQPIEQQPLTVTPQDVETPPGAFLQAEAARFNPQLPNDEIVLEMGNSAPSSLGIYRYDTDQHVFKTLSQLALSQTFLSRMAIGNFDKQQTSNGKTQHDPTPEIAFLYGEGGQSTVTAAVYSIDPKSSQLVQVSSFPQQAPSFAVSLFAPANFYITAGDLQGRSYVLGEPTKVSIQGNIQASVIASMPPMHVDYVTSAEGKQEIVNFSAVPDGFNTTYQNSTETKVESSGLNTISYSFGAKETLGGSVSVGDPDVEGLNVSDVVTATQDLKGTVAQQYGTLSSIATSQTNTTGYGDFIQYTQNNFYIWIYPVIGKTVCPSSIPNCSSGQAVPMTIQFSAPQDSTVASLGSSSVWYQPPWEPGNVFSYPANKSQLQAIYPNMALLSRDSIEWFTDSSSNNEQTTWNVQSSSGTTSTLDQTYSFENDFSVAGKVSLVEFGAGVNYGLDLSGSVGLSALHQSTSTLAQSTGIGIQKKGSFADVEQYKYGVTSYLIGRKQSGNYVDATPPSADVQTFDFLQAAFVANPLGISAGAWWGQHYRDRPDVALNHPDRWHINTPALSSPVPPECLATGTGASQMDCVAKEQADPLNPWGSPFYHMRGLFISSAAYPGKGPLLTQATAGTKLSLQARVYNYSFATMPTGSTVHVRFYAQPWDQTKNIALLGKPSFLVGTEDTLNPIPPFSDADNAPLNWTLAGTTFDTTGHDGQFFTFWVVAWMEDENKALIAEPAGHGLQSIPGDLTSFAQVQTEDYSNNLGFWRQSFYVAPQGDGANSTPGATKAKLNIGKIQFSTSHVSVGEPITVSALLAAESAGASNVAAFFWDEDPESARVAFSLDTPSYIEAGGTHQVSATYRPKACGTHQLFITVGKGTANEVIRRSPPLRVDCGAQR